MSSKEQSVELKLSPLSNKKILDIEGGTAPKAIPEDTSDVGLGEDGMPLNPKGGEPGVQFTSSGRDPANGDAKVEIGPTGVPHFVGLGKEELMKYANDPFWVRLRWILFALFWLIWLAMLVGAIIIIVLAPKCANKANTEAQNLVAKNGPYYQIFLKAFSPDETFSGLEEKLPYLESLGVKTLIISQFLDTAGKSGISEVVNFEAIDPSYGLNFEGFKELVNRFSEKGLRILLQFIPNHSSKSHPWFSTHPDFYVVKKKADVEKSTWENLYKGKAWSPVNQSEDSDYYLHQFKESEPDLNYKNPKVVEEMNKILRKWYSTGVDGFLLSDVSYLTEDLDNLGSEESKVNQQGNLGVVESLVNKKSWGLEKNRSSPYYLLDLNGLSTQNSLETYSKDNLLPVIADWAELPSNFNETQLKDAAESEQFVLRRLSSPRLPRLETRFRTPRAYILAMVSFMLRGEVVLYYGEELGMTSLTDSPSPTELDISTKKMDWQFAESASNPRLQFYKDLINLHKDMNQTTKEGGTTEFYTAPGIFAFKRETVKNFVVVTNLGDSEQKINIKEKLKATDKATVVSVTPGVKSPDKGANITTSEVIIPAESGIVLELIKDD